MIKSLIISLAKYGGDTGAGIAVALLLFGAVSAFVVFGQLIVRAVRLYVSATREQRKVLRGEATSGAFNLLWGLLVLFPVYVIFGLAIPGMYLWFVIELGRASVTGAIVFLVLSVLAVVATYVKKRWFPAPGAS